LTNRLSSFIIRTILYELFVISERRILTRMFKNFFATRWGIIGVGGLIGVFAALLQKLGNPGNMGICVACFERDIAGTIGIHRAAVVQYMRPEIIGFVLGSLVAAKANRLAGYYARPTPATQVIEIIRQIPRALEEILQEKVTGKATTK
jgi:hypothetical protein